MYVTCSMFITYPGCTCRMHGTMSNILRLRLRVFVYGTRVVTVLTRKGVRISPVRM
jgi:hypothetical protein